MQRAEYSIPKVIAASAVGTMIEWYDFYIFGSLATVISPLFYPQGNDTLALIAYLSTFAVGFVVRPFGALFFGRIGDIVGRKYAFLVTLLIMGGATALIGVLPTYATIGIAAPIILLVIRILQGLALGGEYGGAAVYVAEHVPDSSRGFYTSFIQITATLGLFVSLAVILGSSEHDERGRVPRLGMAGAIPDFDRSGARLALHPPQDAGVPDLHAHQERGDDVGAAPEGGVHAMGQSEAGAGLALRSHGGAGRRLVHGAVLCAVLSPDHPECSRHVGQLHRRDGAPARDAVLRRVRMAVRSYRPQEDHDGGVPARSLELPADLPRHAGGRRARRS